MPRWSPADIADAVTLGLKERAAADDLEQAVYGFDSLDELGLHPIIQQALRQPGWGVWPEMRYPGGWGHSKRSAGKRCDIALTPDAGPIRDPDVKGTLFDNMSAWDPQDAYWLEIKTVAQFESAGPFARYSAELLSPVTADVKKLWTDSLIRHAGLLLVLFTVDDVTARHDLLAWHRRSLDKGFPVTAPAARGFPIPDRIGNGFCSVAVFGVRGA